MRVIGCQFYYNFDIELDETEKDYNDNIVMLKNMKK